VTRAETDRTVRVYYGPALAAYGFGNDHPFGPDRLDAFWREFKRRRLDERVAVSVPVMCAESDLALFHTPAYIARVRTASRHGSGFLDYGDTPAFVGVYEAAATVVGSVLDAADAILAGSCARAFVPIAGLHHARRDMAGGFCVFNDLGVLIEWLRARHGVRRIAYVDIDAHHGDGVFYEFEDDPELIVVDVHEDGRYLYPGSGSARETGTGRAEGTKRNVPMAPGADDDAFQRLWPELEAFVRDGRPEFILLQAGADSIRGDPLTHLAYSAQTHGRTAARLARLADELCDGRLLATGGGGYDRDNLASAWCEVVARLLPDNENGEIR
jgi:acetoin utilization protein AcuC